MRIKILTSHLTTCHCTLLSMSMIMFFYINFSKLHKLLHKAGKTVGQMGYYVPMVLQYKHRYRNFIGNKQKQAWLLDILV
ncbi:hypothetical protein [Metabacillus idriensis]|uniref:hypothetical protein n=1 Tax=Metabacillus idriensis TaxID=324768 RepID=UPI001749A9F8|nr:hypothetical protein [Metabacillus idriensis]